MELLELFGTDHPVVGVVHLPPLPGAPGYAGDRERIRDRALADGNALVDGGVDGIVLENFGDAPFHPEDVPKHVVADMTALATSLTDAVDVPVGINVLRNDADAALSVAAAADASFVRINVHVGTAATDQGVLEGRAHETMRLRERIDAPVAALADVHVKHATPVGDQRLEHAVRETLERGRADGVIVSGPGTGRETDLEDVARAADAAHGLEYPKPTFVGSGVTADTVGDVFAAGADGVIVGTALEEGGVTGNPVELERVERVTEAARAAR